MGIIITQQISLACLLLSCFIFLLAWVYVCCSEGIYTSMHVQVSLLL